MTSVVGTQHLLALAERCGADFLFASTSEVYGDPRVHPQREDYFGNVNPTGPRACYDEGKRAAESLAFDYDRAARGTVRVARIFNTYGPRLSAVDGRVVSNVVVQALVRDTITRSEEHTSELQSLMRISYAVFCLKKKKKDRTKNEL